MPSLIKASQRYSLLTFDKCHSLTVKVVLFSVITIHVYDHMYIYILYLAPSTL